MNSELSIMTNHTIDNYNVDIDAYDDDLKSVAYILQSLSQPREEVKQQTHITRDASDCVRDCAICMDPFGETNKMILKCGHQFCGDCILHHFQLEGGTACPMCRQEFATRVENWRPPSDSDSESEYDSDDYSSDDESTDGDSLSTASDYLSVNESEFEDSDELNNACFIEMISILKEDDESIPDVELRSDAMMAANEFRSLHGLEQIQL